MDAFEQNKTQFRSSLVRQRSRQLVELTNVLDKMFPEFKPFFKGKFSATALYILDHYQSPERIASMNTRSYEPLRKISRGHFSLNDFVKLKTLAKNTVGCTTEFLLQEMSILLELYTQLDAKVEELDDQIEECVRGIDPPMLSIPGVGASSAAVILSEYGDFSKFKNSSKTLAFAGLEPGYFQSGQFESTGHMVASAFGAGWIKIGRNLQSKPIKIAFSRDSFKAIPKYFSLQFIVQKRIHPESTMSQRRRKYSEVEKRSEGSKPSFHPSLR